MPTLLLINGQPQRFDAQEITIGRNPANTISLPHDTRLAANHAILKAVGGRWIVEAREGGPLRVGAGRPTRFAWVNPGDVIHLTDTGPELVLEPGSTAPAPAVTAAPLVGTPAPTAPTTMPRGAASASSSSVPTTAETPLSGVGGRTPPGTYAVAQRETPPPEVAKSADEEAADRKWILRIVACGLAVFALIAFGIMLGNWGRTASSGATGESPETGPEQADLAANSRSAEYASSGSGRANSSRPAGTEPAVVATATVTDPLPAVYRVELRVADGTHGVQYGTAWAVGPRQLVTTGDVARGMARNQEYYPLARAVPAASTTAYEITRIIVHPEYEPPANRLDDAIRNIEQQKMALAQAETEEERQQIIAELRHLDELAIVAADETVHVNLAVLEVDRPLPAMLSWADASASAKVGQRLLLAGYVLTGKELQIDPEKHYRPEQRPGRLKMAEDPHSQSTPPLWLAGFDDLLADQNWSGSPILDSRGTVVALYSRPTPPLVGKNPAGIVTHDLTLLGGLKALLTEK
ncbi:MAG: hypothetical protein JSS02_17325 [Planctomycetes bacterium]|nr:hypothetical protein [Planctomycetota bacterium]